MSTVTIDEEEFRRLKAAAGEEIDSKAARAFCGITGHTWKSLGGTNAGCGRDCGCSRPVNTCIVCGDCDYGENAEGDEIVKDCAERHPEEQDDGCDYCADHVPAKGYWRCPVCDAEWNEEET